MFLRGDPATFRVIARHLVGRGGRPRDFFEMEREGEKEEKEGSPKVSLVSRAP